MVADERGVYLGVTILLLLSAALLMMGLRLVQLALRRMRPREPEAPRDLLMDTLRDQMLAQQQASADRRESVLAYEALQTLHGTIMEQMPVGVLVLDFNGQVQYANPIFMVWWDVPQISGQALAEISQALALCFNRLKAGVESEESTVLPIGETTRHFIVSLNALPEDRFLLSLVDKTRERDLEERIRYKRDLELMGELAAGVTHEVKNALAVIQGRVQMLAYGDVPTQAEKITAEVDRLLSFVDQFTRAGQHEPFSPEAVQLPEWFDELAAFWRDHPKADFVHIHKPDPHIQPIQGDVVLLTTVINNLVLNGVQACEEAGVEPPRVEVSATGDPQRVVVTVMDMGPGFSPSAREKLFVPFVTSKKKGTGLGMFYCRKVMMEHGGEMEVCFDKPTRVLCKFPVGRFDLRESEK